MLFSILSGGDPKTILASLLLSLPIIIMALSFHETAHGYIAYKCGDNTAYNLGRLSLNPLNHLDLVGTVCMLVFGFGWAKPVPINTRNFRNPRRGMALSALAGPMANLLLGAIFAVLFGISWAGMTVLSYTSPESVGTELLFWTAQLCSLGAIYNFLFMAFNMIPVPPFDGSRIALLFLPPKAYFGIMKYERQIMFGLLIALFVLSRFGFSPFGFIAEKLTGLIATPVCNLFIKLFFPH